MTLFVSKTGKISLVEQLQLHVREVAGDLSMGLFWSGARPLLPLKSWQSGQMHTEIRVINMVTIMRGMGKFQNLKVGLRRLQGFRESFLENIHKHKKGSLSWISTDAKESAVWAKSWAGAVGPRDSLSTHAEEKHPSEWGVCDTWSREGEVGPEGYGSCVLSPEACSSSCSWCGNVARLWAGPCHWILHFLLC